MSQNKYREAFLFLSDEIWSADADNSKSLFPSKFFAVLCVFKGAIISDSKHFKTSLTSQQSFLSNSGFMIKDNPQGSFYNKTAINKGPYISDWMSRFSILQTWVSTVSYISRKSLTLSDEIN